MFSKIRCFFILLLPVFQIGFSQTFDINQPKGIAVDLDFTTVKTVETDVVDVEEQLRLDSINGQTYRRFGYEHHVQINMLSPEYLTEVENGHLYILKIHCPEAKSINLIFDSFYIENGAELSLYELETNNFIGAYTSKNNNDYHILGTDLLKTDELYVEVYFSNGNIGNSSLVIGTIVHGYRAIEDMFLEDMTRNLNSSGNCNLDVNCPQGQGWEMQRNSVARIMMGGSFCSGSLVNNTSDEIIPYVLTANHCTLNAPSPGAWVYRFRWEAPVGGTSCATSQPSADGPTNFVINGSELKANNRNADFLLVELFQAPEVTWGIYYNGWDRRENVPFTSGTTIHHPRGDIKKIALSSNALQLDEVPFNGNQNTKVWRVINWTEGVTEQSSSGAPLFNQDKRLIGTLAGGTAVCAGTINNNGFDVFGRFGIAWDNLPDPANQLMYWLDPIGSGDEFIDGIDPNAATFDLDVELTVLKRLEGVICGPAAHPKILITNRGANPLTSVDINYTYNDQIAQTITWEGFLPTGFNAEVWLPELETISGENNIIVNLSNPNNGVDENETNNSIQMNFLSAKDGEFIRLFGQLDCFADEVSWQILDDSGVMWHESRPFQNLGNASQLVDTSYCLAEGCYELVVSDSFGDGWQGSDRPSCNFDGYLTVSRSTNDALLAVIDETNIDFGESISLPFCAENTASLNDEKINEIGFVVFPNPSNGSFTISFENEFKEDKKVVIYDSQGKKVVKSLISSQKSHFDLSLNAGVYTVQIIEKGSVYSKRLVIFK